MEKKITSKVSVLIQGEGSNGEIIDRSMDCNSVAVFGISEDAIDIGTFGAFNSLEAANLADAMDDLKQTLFNDFPMAKLLATLGASKELRALMSEEEDEEDE